MMPYLSASALRFQEKPPAKGIDGARPAPGGQPWMDGLMHSTPLEAAQTDAALPHALIVPGSMKGVTSVKQCAKRRECRLPMERSREVNNKTWLKLLKKSLWRQL